MWYGGGKGSHFAKVSTETKFKNSPDLKCHLMRAKRGGHSLLSRGLKFPTQHFLLMPLSKGATDNEALFFTKNQNGTGLAVADWTHEVF